MIAHITFVGTFIALLCAQGSLGKRQFLRQFEMDG